MATQGFDYDVIVIGSGFGGSVAAMRATEKGYRVGVMEAGKRWRDEDIPKTSWDIRKFAWQPEAEMYGIQRMEFLDDVLVLCGAGVGGGSHVYGNTLYIPPKKFFDAPEWAGITDWADEVAPYIDQASRMLGVVRVPYMDTQVDRLMREVARDMGKGNSYNRAPVGVYFGTPDVEADDPYFGGAGPKRRGCINCGNCMIGCGRNSKNKLTVNYLYLAEKFGAKIHELQEVHELKPLEAAGSKCTPATPAGRNGRRTYTITRTRRNRSLSQRTLTARRSCCTGSNTRGRCQDCRTNLASAPAPIPSSSSRSCGRSETGSTTPRRSTSHPAP